MPKGSVELTNARENEIIDACAKLYGTMGFKEITIKDIGNATSFTRTSIYNYFQTKEEIFLALLGREYEAWNRELLLSLEKKDTMTKEELALLLADTLSKRELMLKLLSMNMFEIEENSRVEKLVEFKKAFGEAMALVGRCLDRLEQKMTEEEKKKFRYSFFPFMQGIYPYASPTKKQEHAMEQAGLEFGCFNIYEMVYMTAKRLLGA